MKIKLTSIKGCFIFLPKKNYDQRGSFHRSFCKDILKKKKINFGIKQCNVSTNEKMFTLRGFHYQSAPGKESKIISVNNGSIFNVTIDLRKSSKTFLKVTKNKLSSKKNQLILIPAGCANAFLTLNKKTIVHYYMSEVFERQNKKNYKGFRFDDPFFKIKWPFKPKVLSLKDKNLKNFQLKNI